MCRCYGLTYGKGVLYAEGFLCGKLDCLSVFDVLSAFLSGLVLYFFAFFAAGRLCTAFCVFCDTGQLLAVLYVVQNTGDRGCFFQKRVKVFSCCRLRLCVQVFQAIF